MSARALMIPAWTETVAALQAAEDVRVYQKCHACQAERLVDLAGLIAEFGPLYSLWNREPPCWEPGCAGKTWFRAQPRNYFHRILLGAPPYLVQELHERWRASLPADVRDTLPVVPMMIAAGMCVAVGCGACQLLAYLGSVDVRSWGAGVTLNELVARIRCREACAIAVDLVALAQVPPADRPPMG